MFNNNEEKEVDIDLEDTEETHTDEVELEDIEEKGADKLKKLREKLKTAEADKKEAQDELQRTRAEFLNARRRLEEDRARDKIRYQKKHIERLLPLCDSFQMAMSDTEAWEKADESWRKGITGIYGQLQSILKEAGVAAINPTGEAFDPNKHEAIGTEPVTDKSQDDTVVSVMQNGYEIAHDGKTEIIRPARVTIGSFSE